MASSNAFAAHAVAPPEIDTSSSSALISSHLQSVRTDFCASSRTRRAPMIERRRASSCLDCVDLSGMPLKRTDDRFSGSSSSCVAARRRSAGDSSNCGMPSGSKRPLVASASTCVHQCRRGASTPSPRRLSKTYQTRDALRSRRRGPCPASLNRLRPSTRRRNAAAGPCTSRRRPGRRRPAHPLPRRRTSKPKRPAASTGARRGRRSRSCCCACVESP